MKTHKTIQITREMLLATRPCALGLAAVEHLLPMTFSTDPEENVDLAHELASDLVKAAGDVPDWYFGSNAWWMRELCPADRQDFDRQLNGLYYSCMSPKMRPLQRDFSLTCQMIAIVAEILLSERGE